MSTAQSHVRTYRNPNYQVSAGFTLTLFVGISIVNVASSLGLRYFGIAVQVLFTGWAAASVRRWWTTTLIVTTHQLVARRGRATTEMPFDRIADIYLDDFLFVRMASGESIRIRAVQNLEWSHAVELIYALGNFGPRRADRVLDDLTATWLRSRSAS